MPQKAHVQTPKWYSLKVHLGKDKHGPLGEAVGQVPVQGLDDLDRSVGSDLEEGGDLVGLVQEVGDVLGHGRVADVGIDGGDPEDAKQKLKIMQNQYCSQIVMKEPIKHFKKQNHVKSTPRELREPHERVG